MILTTLPRAAVAAVASVLVLALWVGVAAAAPGDLDPSYGSGTGASRLDFGHNEFGLAVALQPDGKIIVAGVSSTTSSIPDALVVRLNNPQGTPDTSFGPGTGASQIDLGQVEAADALALQPDGKIIVAGTTSGSGSDAFVARLGNPQGTLDPSYGGGAGWSRISFGFRESASAVALQPDGKIVIAGSATDSAGNNGDFLAARLNNPEGTFDASYGLGSGGSRVDLGQSEFGDAVALQADGKILVAGTQKGLAPGAAGDFLVVRLLNPQGTLDPSFDGSGHATVDFGNDDTATAMAVQPDGKILLAGDTFVNGAGDLAVTRLLSNGLPDNSFGSGGKATIDLGGSEFGEAMALQPDGKIIVVGLTVQGTQESIAVARLQPDGTLDGTFGNGGKAIVNPLGGQESGDAVALQPDGKIIIAGGLTSAGGSDDMLVVRLQGDSSGGGGAGGGGSGGGSGPSGTLGAPRDSALSVNPGRFAAAGSGATLTRRARKTGATISYRDSQSATSTFTIESRHSGVRQRGHCVAPRRHPARGSHPTKCTRYLRSGSFTHADIAGSNRFHFTGRLGGGKLASGDYRMTAIPRNRAGRRGTRVRRSFTVL